MASISSYLCSLSLICGPKGHTRLSQSPASRSFYMDYLPIRNRANQILFHTKPSRLTSKRYAKSSESEEKVPSWAQLDSDEPPPWASEDGKPVGSKEGAEVPFFVYLLASAVTAIAAIGSIFEYANQKPVFGLLNSDSVFYAPILGFFAFTGIPTSAFLWYKSVQTANKEAEEQDRRDGYRAFLRFSNLQTAQSTWNSIGEYLPSTGTSGKVEGKKSYSCYENGDGGASMGRLVWFQLPRWRNHIANSSSNLLHLRIHIGKLYQAIALVSPISLRTGGQPPYNILSISQDRKDGRSQSENRQDIPVFPTDGKLPSLYE